VAGTVSRRPGLPGQRPPRFKAITDLVGHRTTIVSQKVYRHQLRPVMSKGAATMNAIFTKQEEPRAGWPVGSRNGQTFENEWAIQDLNL
jgi:hypothetical protein